MGPRNRWGDSDGFEDAGCAKYSALERFYKDNIKELEALIPIEKVLNPKWRNAGESTMSLTQDMMTKITKISQDLKIIYALKSEFEQQMIDTYLIGFDMSASLQTQTRLEGRKKALEEIKKLQEQKAQEQAQEPQESIEFHHIFSPVSVDNVMSVPVIHTEQTKTIKVIFYDTTEAFRKEMKALTDKHNIKYGGTQ